jgi:drug/metabolite transporter (DMT)-like permease
MPDAGADTGNSRETLAAVLLMSSAMIIVPVMDIIAKYLSAAIPPLEVTFGRFFFQTVIAVSIATLSGRFYALRSKRPMINYIRGLLLCGAVLSFFTAVKYMSVATAISIFFVEPAILTIMAALILKEKVGWRRIAAIVVGFFGAMIILRPNFLEIGAASLLPLLTATLFASYLLLNRLFAGTDGLLAIQFSAGVAGTLFLGALLAVSTALGLPDYAFILPDIPQIGLLFTIGAISFVGHGLVVVAFQKGEAALLAPLQYLEIVSATLFGYLVFADFPDGPTWIGIALIVASGLYIAHRERTVSRQQTQVHAKSVE